MNANNGDPLAEQTAVYRGSSRAQASQLLATDAERARAAGYVVIAETWTQEADQFVLTVRYARSSPPAPVWAAASNPSAPAPVSATKKPRSRAKLIVAGIVVLFVGVGLSNSAKDEPGTPPQATAAERTTAAEQRTTAAVVSSDSVRWEEFRVWAMGDLQSITEDLDATSKHALAGDMSGTMDASAGMNTTATRLLAYLSGHPSAPCYSAVHSDLTTALTSFRAAGAAGRDADFEAAVSAMSQGSASLETATAGLTAAHAACTS